MSEVEASAPFETLPPLQPRLRSANSQAHGLSRNRRHGRRRCAVSRSFQRLNGGLPREFSKKNLSHHDHSPRVFLHLFWENATQSPFLSERTLECLGLLQEGGVDRQTEESWNSFCGSWRPMP